MNKMESALYYAETLGWKVFPIYEMDTNGECACRTEKCKEKEQQGKHPRIGGGLTNASNDSEQIKEWWGDWPNANIGVATGAVSGFFALDIDTKEDKEGKSGFYALNKLIENEKDPLPETPTSKTGSGGKHILFKYPDWDIRNSQSKIGNGLDIRGNGGYIIVPPSNHVSGGVYEWADRLNPVNVGYADMPQWLNDALTKTVSKYASQAKTEYEGRVWDDFAKGADIPNGQRNDSLFKIGCAMRGQAASFKDILATLSEINRTRVSPPVEESEVETAAVQASKYDVAIDAIEQNKSLLFYADTDSGNAERLAQRHGVDMKYCRAWDSKRDSSSGWLIWDGTKWARDEYFEIGRKALSTIRAFREELQEEMRILLEEQKKANSDELKEKIKTIEKRIRFSLNSENESKLKSISSLARKVQGMSIAVHQLDKDPYLVNLKNGTYNLKTGELQPHKRNDLITKIAGIDYDPKATSPRWEQFVYEIMNEDTEMSDYLKRVSGLCLSGDTTEEHLFMPHGTGGNGKSKYIEAMLDVLGDYGQQASSSLLMAKGNNPDAPNPELARVRGARFVVTSETSEGKKLDEELVKLLTGNDVITTRKLYEDTFSFKPEAKFFVSTNHKPMIKGTDKGIWRRVLLIPFEVSFEGKQKDIRLAEKLLAESSGILNWLIEGFKEWREQGIQPPEKIVAATLAYKEEMDSLGSFITEMCIVDPEAKNPIKPLYHAFKKWCEDNSEFEMNSRMFAKRLEERGFKRVKGTARFWKGIRVKTTAEITAEENQGQDTDIQEIQLVKQEAQGPITEGEVINFDELIQISNNEVKI